MTGQTTAGTQIRPTCRVGRTANATYASGAQTPVQFDAESFDTDNMHTTSAANLTGTVTKAASSATLTGTGTAFTTELSPGDAIFVPDAVGGGWILGEFAVVQSIASDTSLTVAQAFHNAASAQTARHASECIVFRTSGIYWVRAKLIWAASTAGRRAFELAKNGVFPNSIDVGTAEANPITATSISTPAETQTLVQASQYDFVLISPFQNSGASLDLLASSDHAPKFEAIWQSIW